ncbi:hypothetical protein MRX96_007004 [Rhipicephalus microplus]
MSPPPLANAHSRCRPERQGLANMATVEATNWGCLPVSRTTCWRQLAEGTPNVRATTALSDETAACEHSADFAYRALLPDITLLQRCSALFLTSIEGPNVCALRQRVMSC